MRDYTHFDGYVSRVQQDVYAQPPDGGHIAWGQQAINMMLAVIGNVSGQSVLDVGCGQAVLAKVFQAPPFVLQWTGVTIGEDYQVASAAQPGRVLHEDMSFLPFADKTYDIVFARHALEHSPFPLLTLMEWRRVCRSYLLLVLPAPEFWTSRGRNHYSVLQRDHWLWLFDRAGWSIVWQDDFRTDNPLWIQYNSEVKAPSPALTVEYRFLLDQKQEKVE